MRLPEIKKLTNKELGEKLAWDLTGIIPDAKVYKFDGDFRFNIEGGINCSVEHLCDRYMIISVESRLPERLQNHYLNCLCYAIGFLPEMFTPEKVFKLHTSPGRNRAEAMYLALQKV